MSIEIVSRCSYFFVPNARLNAKEERKTKEKNAKLQYNVMYFVLCGDISSVAIKSVLWRCFHVSRVTEFRMRSLSRRGAYICRKWINRIRRIRQWENVIYVAHYQVFMLILLFHCTFLTWNILWICWSNLKKIKLLYNWHWLPKSVKINLL